MTREAKAMWLAGGLLLVAATSGCGGHDVERIDTGKLCLYGEPPFTPGVDGPSQQLAADRAITVSVSTEECISPCVDHELATCSVQLHGSTMVVESVLAWDEPAGDEACVALCGGLVAVCSTPPLPAGSYEVVHGSTERSLAIPSTDVEPCSP